MSKSAELLRYFDSKINEALGELKRLVELESNSLDKSGVDALADYLAGRFRLRGAQAELLPEREHGNLLKATLRGVEQGGAVMVLGHLDTVWAAGTVSSRPFAVKDGKVYGPGVFDMKGGILLCLLACEAFHAGMLRPSREVIFFFTSDEETGTHCGLPHLRSAAAGCAAVLCLEPPLRGGNAKTFRKAVATYRIRVRGIASHAGVDHAAGANAIAELCRIILDLQSMTDYARGVTVSVGTFHGGTASNVVPALAVAEIDIRTCGNSDASWMDNRIRSLVAADTRFSLEIQGGINRPPLERTPQVVALLRKAQTVAAELGMALGEGGTGGGSDGSFTADMGIPTLDGLGVDGDGAHAEHEHIAASDIPRRAALLCRLLETI